MLHETNLLMIRSTLIYIHVFPLSNYFTHSLLQIQVHTVEHGDNNSTDWGYLDCGIIVCGEWRINLSSMDLHHTVLTAGMQQTDHYNTQSMKNLLKSCILHIR